MFPQPFPKIPIQQIRHSLLEQKRVRLYLQREDLLHPQISGNKWRKLKYNMLAAQQKGHDRIVTFGGAFSNHIAATAAAAQLTGLASVGIIRGEEHLPLNPTLALATEKGMQLHYVSRQAYKDKQQLADELRDVYGNFYLVPEGGSNALAVKGCTEMLTLTNTSDYDYYAVACGTGGTLAGVLAGLNHCQQALGFPALKGGSFLKPEIDALTQAYNGKTYHNFQLVTDYHFGGYAKFTPELISFINKFKATQQIPLDPVYTGKMMYGLFAMVDQDRFKTGASILAFHTGGLQGIAGFNQRFGALLAT